MSAKKHHWMKIQSKGAEFLSELLYQTELVLQNIHNPSLAFRYGLEDAIEIREHYREASYWRAIRRLEKRNMIRIEKIGERYYARLSDTGLIETLSLQVVRSPKLQAGVTCLVVFDIPTSHSRIRKQLRNFLKRVGFEKIQQSVWSIDREVSEDLKRIFQFKYAKEWVRIYQAIEKV